MGGFESSNSDFLWVNFDTMKRFLYTETAQRLILQGFSDMKKARWLRIKTIVLIWSEWRDSNSRHPGPKPGALPTGPHPDIKLRENARCGQICGQGNSTTGLPNFQRK